MSERGMSEAAMLAGLRDIRLPAEAAGGWIADIAAAVALAALAALVVGGVLRLLSRRRPKVRPLSLARRLEAAVALPEEARRTALLHLMKEHAPERFAELRKGLYRPGEGPDPGAMEAELRRVA